MPLLFLLAMASLFAAQQKDVATEPPALGSIVPKAIVAARHASDTCLTASAHFDPCAEIVSEHMNYIVAWDKATSKVVYVFTSDLTFVTDSELGVGASTRVDRRKLVKYKDWLIAPDIADTSNGEGTGNKWYPVVTLLDVPSADPNMTYATVAGFVQSQYVIALLQQPAKTQ